MSYRMLDFLVCFVVSGYRAAPQPLCLPVRVNSHAVDHSNALCARGPCVPRH
ncbi:hypothetical protein PR003_g31959 [Phytophthora rubi]|uniref:Uncharacterized protein n=1 Tax=Phytophthora rubi TaxID=129364 RepID=A0A6A3J380_9STRA|nr:hypothetical protein PR001_g21964 [Phytophthora rubi]KAE9001049.1 hypothetical protein PR002_g18015 [Phytophthora rubi]KAE9266903.1 hypothetical protein PR003_g31959 [Phytophthora rubi]